MRLVNGGWHLSMMMEKLNDVKNTALDLALALVQLGCAVALLARLVRRK